MAQHQWKFRTSLQTIANTWWIEEYFRLDFLEGSLPPSPSSNWTELFRERFMQTFPSKQIHLFGDKNPLKKKEELNKACLGVRRTCTIRDQHYSANRWTPYSESSRVVGDRQNPESCLGVNEYGPLDFSIILVYPSPSLHPAPPHPTQSFCCKKMGIPKSESMQSCWLTGWPGGWWMLPWFVASSCDIPRNVRLKKNKQGNPSIYNYMERSGFNLWYTLYEPTE